MAIESLGDLVLEAFETQYGWRPDDLDIHVAEWTAKPVSERLGVPVPELAYPVPFDVFAEALPTVVLGGSAARPPDEPAATGLPEVCSQGGPVLAIPLALAAQWRGTDSDDYDRACTQSPAYRATEFGGLDVVDVADGQALVLDLELMTTATRIGDDGFIVRNWSDVPSREDITAWVNAVEQWQTLDGSLVLPDGQLVLFDSAVPGASEADAIESEEGVAVLSLEPGTYTVSFAVHDGLDLIRISR